MRIALRSFFLLDFLALAACGDGGTGAQRFNATGTWTSTSIAGQYNTFTLELTEAGGGTVSGKWTAVALTGGGAGPQPVGGNVSGTNTGEEIQFALQGSPLRFQGRIATSTRMNGTLSYTNTGAEYPAAFTR